MTLASSTNLPTLLAGEILALTLVDAATQLVTEIVYVTAITGAVCTIERGQENTSARTWSVGDLVLGALTAGEISNFLQVENSVPFGGRLTLISAMPVMVTAATNMATVIATPYTSNSPGPIAGLTSFVETNLVLTTVANTSGNLYDVFGFNNSGTFQIGTGPAWSSGTARSAAISRQSGVYYNTSTITLINNGTSYTGIAGGAALYLGTIYCNANG